MQYQTSLFETEKSKVSDLEHSARFGNFFIDAVMRADGKTDKYLRYETDNG